MNSNAPLACLVTIGVTLASAPMLVGAQSLKVGEADIYPTVKLSYTSNSNTYLTNENAVESSGIRVEPLVTFAADRRLLNLNLSYQGDYASFSEDPLNFDDHKFYAYIGAEFDSRNRSSLEAEVSKEHEEFGTGRTFGETAVDGEAVEFVDSRIEGSYTYGAPTARGNITAGLLFGNTSYLNRDDITNGADKLEITPYGRFSYRVTPKTRALLELRYRSLDFDSSASDRSEGQALTGFEIQPGGKTSGEVKLGIGRADYSDQTIPDTSYFVVNTNVSYAPTTKANFLIEYERQLDDTDGIGLSQNQAQTISDTAKFSWLHAFSPFVSSNTYIALDLMDRECPALGQRTITGGIELAYNVRRWFQLGAGFVQESRSSDSCEGVFADENSDYEKQTISIFSKITI